MKYLRMLEIQPGGWLLLALLNFFLEVDLLCCVIGSVMIHEMGHLIMLEWFDARIRRIRLDHTGFTIQYNQSKLFGVKGCIAAAAGPSAGITAAVLSSFVGNMMENNHILLFAGTNIILSLFNLLPAKPLDGWRIIDSVFPTAAQVISVCTSFAVLVVGIVLMFDGYGTACALMGIFLLLYDSTLHKRYRLRI